MNLKLVLIKTTFISTYGRQMKNTNNLIFLVLFTILLGTLACKKEKSIPIPPPSTFTPHDTIFPLPYFPVYPASWWKYVDSNNDTIIIWTDSAYQKDYWIYSVQVSDTFYVPIYNNIPIWGYHAHNGVVYNGWGDPFTKILSETDPVGKIWINYTNPFISSWRRVIEYEATINISSFSFYPTIVVEEFSKWGYPSYEILEARRYYTKNIGLIKEEIFKGVDSTLNTRELVDYYINN